MPGSFDLVLSILARLNMDYGLSNLWGYKARSFQVTIAYFIIQRFSACSFKLLQILLFKHNKRSILSIKTYSSDTKLARRPQLVCVSILGILSSVIKLSRKWWKHYPIGLSTHVSHYTSLVSKIRHRLCIGKKKDMSDRRNLSADLLSLCDKGCHSIQNLPLTFLTSI